jgi:hypothetical protein
VGRETDERRCQRRIAESSRRHLQRHRRRLIYLFYCGFRSGPAGGPGLHAHPYSSKFPPFLHQCAQQVGRALAQQCGGRATGRQKRKFWRTAVGDGHVGRQ